MSWEAGATIHVGAEVACTGAVAKEAVRSSWIRDALLRQSLWAVLMARENGVQWRD